MAAPDGTESALEVQVVSADRVVWSGEATMVVARTVEGDLGIMAGHTPVLAVLVPSGVEVVGVDGERRIVAVAGGFVSVAGSRVSILSEFADLATATSLEAAEAELEAAQAEWQASQGTDRGDQDASGTGSAQASKRVQRALAQVKAAQKVTANN